MGYPTLSISLQDRIQANKYKHANADGLSRLPLHVQREKEEPTDVEIFNVAQVDALQVTAQQLGQATRADPILSKVWQYTKTKWPDRVSV